MKFLWVKYLIAIVNFVTIKYLHITSVKKLNIYQKSDIITKTNF